MVSRPGKKRPRDKVMALYPLCFYENSRDIFVATLPRHRKIVASDYENFMTL
jgi:hypothetical protein